MGKGGGAGFAAKVRAAIRQSVSVDDAEQIMQAQIDLALKGDVAAAKFVFDYAGYKPAEEIHQQQTILDPRLQELAARRGWSFAEGN